jgi:hypothetical protein
MTDAELLAKWRQRRDNRFLTLATARELEKLERRFRHLKPKL